jgi:S-adenosylmethionine synthetase
LKELAVIRREGEQMTYLRPDAKSQVTIEYDEATSKPLRVHTIVVSTQHDEFIKPTESRNEKEAEIMMQQMIREDVKNILIPRVKARLERAGDCLADLIGDEYILHVNPTGKFVIGGPHGDTGLTGRKIIVDTYGGRGAHGGGAFSGKDSSKVDRSAAYAARHIAKNMVAAGVADEVLVQLSYAIGIAEPLSVYVNTYGSKRPAALEGMTDGEIAERIGKLFDLRPASIVKRFGLKNPIFEATASYGHFGNRPYTKNIKVVENGVEVEREVEFFGWERLDAVEQIKAEFGL